MLSVLRVNLSVFRYPFKSSLHLQLLYSPENKPPPLFDFLHRYFYLIFKPPPPTYAAKIASSAKMNAWNTVIRT